MVEAVVSWGSGLALLGATLTIFFNASGRYLIGWSFLGGEELARLLTVWITFVGTFVLVRQEGHVNIDLLLRAVGPQIATPFPGHGCIDRHPGDDLPRIIFL
jgi:TRAP-type C4-dicarboxylate transport system permease small subunit